MNTYQIPLRSDQLSIDANGRLGLKVTPEIYTLIQNGEPFGRGIARGTDKVLQAEIQAEGPEQLTFGADRRVGIAVQSGAKAVLDLVWPEEDPSPLEDYDLQPETDEVYLLLSVDGTAQVSTDADVSLPQYPLSGSLGLEAGGKAHYRRAVPFSAQTPAREILTDFVSGIRLPQSVKRVEDLPEVGEVLDLQYSGYLDLGLEASWGYSVKKFEEVAVGDLNLSSQVDVSSQSALQVTCGIAGEYALQVRRDPDRDTWARVTVRKKRRRSIHSTLDVQTRVQWETDGLPEEASSFVSALLGTEIPDQVKEMRTLLDDPDQLLARLEDELDALTERCVRNLFEKWYPDDEISEKAEPFLDDLRSVLETYDELAEDEGRWTEVLSHFTVEELSGSLETLKNLQERSDLASVAEPVVLKVLRTVAGPDYTRMVSSDTAFSEQKDLIENKLDALLAEGSGQLRDLFALSEEALDLDDLIDELKKYDSAEELKEQAETHLLELASRLVGRGFEQLQGTQLEEAFSTLDKTLHQIEQLTATAYDKFESALNRSYRAEISRTYARTEQNEALFDLRIDLGTDRGRALMQDVVHGNVTAASRRTAAPHCEVLGGSFTTVTQETNRLQVNLLGWEYARTRELSVRANHRIEQAGDGLLHVYEVSAEDREVRQRNRERMEFSFLADLLAKNRRDGQAGSAVDEIVRKLAIEYGFLVEDRSVTDHELKTYLALAEYLRLLPGGMTADGYMESLQSDLGLESGDSWGTVTLNYRVRYDPNRFVELFRRHDERVDESLLRTVFRRIAAANFRGADRQGRSRSARSSMHKNIAKCLLENRYYRIHRDQGLRGVVAENVAPILGTVYNVEDELVETFETFHEIVTADSFDRRQLADAFEELADIRNTLERYLAIEEEDVFVHPFFAIIDQMQALQFSSPDQKRSSYAELQIEQSEKELVRVMTG